jgi:hypothetical protein
MSSRSNTKRRDTSTPELYGSGELYGLKFFDQTTDYIDFDKPIKCTPEINFIENNTKAIFNFSGCSGDDYLDNIFIHATLGNMIEIENGHHFSQNEEYDLTGSYEIKKIFEKTLICDIVTTKAPADYDKRYGGDLFTDKLNIVVGVSSGNYVNYNIVKNYYSSSSTNSFTHLNVRLNDFIRFNNGLNQEILWNISSFFIDENGIETLKLTKTGSTITEENRFDDTTNFNLYRIDTEVETTSSTTGLFYEPIENIAFMRPLLTYDPVGTASYTFNYSATKKPNLIFLKGATYIFNLVGLASNSFRLSSSPDGIWSGGTELKSDIYRIDDILIYKPSSVENLYYYDAVNKNAGGKIYVVEALEGKNVYEIYRKNIITISGFYDTPINRSAIGPTVFNILNLNQGI